jgi:ABC-2 type transport system permease protein
MREILALMRVGWLTALSYRLNLVFSLLGLGLTLVPVYFVAQALQPLAAASISTEGGQYFGFVAVGLAVFFLVSSALLALPNAISGGIGSGTLEALLATPARLPAVLLGLVGFDLSWSALRAAILLLAALPLGVHLLPARAPLALAALLLVLAGYFGLSLGLAAMMLVFRTIGPLGSGLLAGSALLGGVYYSTTVIPSWIQNLSVAVPLTYGLRIMRQALLAGADFEAVSTDLIILSAFSSVLLLCGWLLFEAALRHARGQGSLGQY